MPIPPLRQWNKYIEYTPAGQANMQFGARSNYYGLWMIWVFKSAVLNSMECGIYNCPVICAPLTSGTVNGYHASPGKWISIPPTAKVLSFGEGAQCSSELVRCIAVPDMAMRQNQPLAVYRPPILLFVQDDIEHLSLHQGSPCLTSPFYQ